MKYGFNIGCLFFESFGEAIAFQSKIKNHTLDANVYSDNHWIYNKDFDSSIKKSSIILDEKNMDDRVMKLARYLRSLVECKITLCYRWDRASDRYYETTLWVNNLHVMGLGRTCESLNEHPIYDAIRIAKQTFGRDFSVIEKPC